MRQRFAAVLILVFLSGAFETQTIGAQSGPLVPRHSSVVAMVRVTVPPLIKLVVDPTVVGPDGTPVVTVVTNIPALRGAGGPSLETVDLQDLALQVGQSEGGGGSEASARSVGRGRVLRYTVCPP
jgi:hypothetical protein